jgi:hypothetical protein
LLYTLVPLSNVSTIASFLDAVDIFDILDILELLSFVDIAFSCGSSIFFEETLLFSWSHSLQQLAQNREGSTQFATGTHP